MATHFALKGWGRDGDVFFKSEKNHDITVTQSGDHMRFNTFAEAERFKLRTSNLAQWVTAVELAA